MLKVVKEKINRKVSIEYDKYIPVSLQLREINNGIESVVYWRTGDFQKNLLEIGINKENMSICSITIVICESVYENINLDISYKNVSEGSLKIVEENMKINTFTDCMGEFSVYIDNDRILIIFEVVKEVSCIRNDNIEFLLDAKSNLCGIVIRDVSRVSMEIVKDALIL